jgi:V8-like Glu-specific endopeptidase
MIRWRARITSLFIFSFVGLTVSSCGDGSVRRSKDDDRQATIYNGAPDTGHPTVAVLVVAGGKSLCTTTLVGKQTVLTAAHCVAGFPDVTQYKVQFGNLAYGVTSSQVHPQYPFADKQLTPDKHATHDVAVLRLQSAPVLQPTPIGAITPYQNQLLTLVGYGEADIGTKDFGTKRVAVSTVAHVAKGWYGFGTYASGQGSIRSGDSGGPTFVKVNGQEVQIGVHSMVQTNDGGGIDTRVDTNLQWIQQAAGGDVTVVGGNTPQNPNPGPSPSPNPGPQNPYPGQLQGWGQPCSSHSDCLTGICGSVGSSQPFCTYVCSAGMGCPSGVSCHQTQVPGMGICAAPGPGSAPPNSTPPSTTPPAPGGGGSGFGQPCSHSGDCQSNFCVNINGNSFCTTSCGAGQSCPGTATCQTIPMAGLSYCVP